MSQHDYRTRSGEGVVLVVRARNRYGSAVAGEEVLVDEGELRNAATMAACAPRGELERQAAEREAAKAEAEAKKSPPITTLVEEGLARIRASVDKAKDKAAEEAQVAEAEERERAAMAAAAGDMPEVFAKMDSDMLPEAVEKRRTQKKSQKRQG